MSNAKAAVVEEVDVDDGFFKVYEKANKKKQGVPGFQMNAPLVQNQLVGINGLELEIEGRGLIAGGHLDGVRSPITRAHWVVVNDGSLRNGGLEYRYSTPVLEEENEAMLNGLFQRLKDAGSTIQLSNRCSVHVHCNMKGKTINQITSILATWGMFEALLIDWCGEQRKTNHFCLSMQDAVSVVDAWNTFLRYGSHHWPEGLKYSAVNVLTLWDKGSLEFRCGAGADNTRTPLLWTKFLNRMIEFSTTKYDNPANIAYDVSERGGYEIFNEITADIPEFRKEVVKEMSPAEFNQIVLNGFRTVQPLVLGYPWDQWLSLIKKEYVPNPFVQNKGLKPPPMRRARRIDPAADLWAADADAPNRWAAIPVEPGDEDDDEVEAEADIAPAPRRVIMPVEAPPVPPQPAGVGMVQGIEEEIARREAEWRRRMGNPVLQPDDARVLQDMWRDVAQHQQQVNEVRVVAGARRPEWPGGQNIFGRQIDPLDPLGEN